MGTHLSALPKEEDKVSKTLHFMVTIPNIPDGMPDEVVRRWLRDEISHPEDAAFEASVKVEPIPVLDQVVAANPERDGNGCMIYKKDGEKH